MSNPASYPPSRSPTYPPVYSPQPPPPAPVGSSPAPITRSSAGIWTGVAVAVFGVLVFIGSLILSLVVVGTTFDSHTVEGRETLDLEAGPDWRVSVPVGSGVGVAITDERGTPVPITERPSDARIERSDDLETVGWADVPADGRYTIDAGDGTAVINRVDLSGSVAAIGVVGLGLVTGGSIFVLGCIIGLLGLIYRFT